MSINEKNNELEQLVATYEGDEDDDAEVVHEKDGRNGVAGTSLAIISTIMGGGIVSIPFAYSVAGPAIGSAIQLTVILAIGVSCILYLRTRDILRCNTTFSVIANLCLGPISGIILNMLLVFAVFGIMALYMILFSEIAISLIGGSAEKDSFLCHKAFYVISLSALLSPILVRKRIQELKVSTYVLFFGVICLIVLLTGSLLMNGSYAERIEQSGVTIPVVVRKPLMMEDIMDSVNISVASQGFVIALFPIYSSMARNARPKVMQSITGALLFTMGTYTLLSMVSIVYFGQDNIKPSIFENIQEQEGISSILLRFLFLIIFFCNIPFVFFAGKLALMAVISQCFFEKKPSAIETEATEHNPNDDVEHFMRAEDSAPNSPGEEVLTAPARSQDDDDAFSTSFVSQSVRGEIKPEDMLPNWAYLSIVFVYLALVCGAAIFIDDLTLIFGIIAGLAECSTVFILPSIFYLVACS
jgi:amino acid permease